MKLFYQKSLWLLLLISFAFRLFRLEIPAAYIFDEVYHVPAIHAISQRNIAAYNPFAQAPEPNTAYDWLHPPLAKLIQAGSVKIFGDNSFGWRFPSAVFGTAAIAALYYLGLVVFKNKNLALLAAIIFSLDNLQLTMSRIAMNDIFVTTWILLALAFFFRRRLLLTSLFTGLALATKHSAILLYPIFLLFSILIFIKKSSLKLFFQYFYSFCLLPLFIYFLSYSQLFILGGSFTDFINLHKQIFYYQTHLIATHGYQSTAWQWPLLIRPVWFYVEYSKNSVANIYNLGNPAIFWGGLVSVFYLLSKGRSLFTDKVRPCHLFLFISYFSLFFPFVFSPRIMFLHHYLPALPFLCLIIASVIYKNKRLITYYLLIITLCFIFFYPLNAAVPLPTNLVKYWFWLPSWR